MRAHYDLSEDERARLDRICAGIMAEFAAAGYARAALPIVQPAELYLDMAGEDVRERMFFFEDPAGAETCLRADLTIPLCRSAIDDPQAEYPRRLACFGPVFRFDPADAPASESLQAGIECLGAEDRKAADIEVLLAARRAVAATGDKPIRVEIGDVSLFQGLLEELAIHDVWERKLTYAFRHPSLLGETLDEARKPAVTAPAKVALDVGGKSAPEVEELVRGALLARSLELIGGRTIEEIAAGLLDRALGASAPRPGEAVLRVIEAFLGISAPELPALGALKGLGLSGDGPFARRVAGLEARLSRLRAGLDAQDQVFISTTLGRRFHYYTGFVFSLVAGGSEPVASGGRYDGLMRDLGSPAAVPAVGCAIWPERLLQTGTHGG